MVNLAEPPNGGLPEIAPGTTVAVTGATGFIGGRLVERLAGNKAEVTCFVRGANAGMRLHRAGARMLELDLADAEAVRGALEEIEVVFHLAYDWGDAGWNERALRALIAGCRANGCRRLVHVSSFAVYDIPDGGEMTESTSANTATSGYAHTKIALETALLAAVRDHHLPAAILQPTIVYGPYSRPWTLDPVDMLRHGKVILPDSGEGVCNAVYVDDVVSAMILAAQRPEAIGQRYLVSGPAPVTWKEFYEGIAKMVGARGPEFRPAAAIEQANRKSASVLGRVTDPERLVRRVANIGPARKLVKAGLRVLPGGLRQSAHHRLFGPVNQRPGFEHLPNPDHLHFLQGRSVIGSAKAKAELGYAPAFGFEQGLVPTARYLKDVYLKPG